MKNIFETSFSVSFPFEDVLCTKGYWVILKNDKSEPLSDEVELSKFKKEWNKYLERKISGINDFISIKNNAITCRYRTRIKDVNDYKFGRYIYGKWKDGLFLGYKKDDLSTGHVYDEKTKKVITVWIDSEVIFTGDSDG